MRRSTAAFARLLLLALCWAVAKDALGQPRGPKRPLDRPGTSARPQTALAWELFNSYLAKKLKSEAIQAFGEVFDPDSPAYNEHILNDLTAKRMRQRIETLLENLHPVEISIVFWDADTPAGFEEFVNRGMGVVGYTKCIYPPENVLDAAGQIIMQPCREGGSVFDVIKSPRFLTGPDEEERLRGVDDRIPKRGIIFYTPSDARILISSLGGFPLGALLTALRDAVSKCSESLSFATMTHLNLNLVAQCISGKFIEKPLQRQTALRGVIVVIDVAADVAGYSAPGYSCPLGKVYRVPIPLPTYVADRVTDNKFKLWAFANVPVIVASK